MSMPEGVNVVVEDGFATVEFVDKKLGGPALAKVFAQGTPPELVEKRTRPRVTYTMPEGNARAAGLLDEADVPAAIVDTTEIPDGEAVPEPVLVEGGPLPDGSLPVLETSGDDAPKSWPDGEPNDDWKRPELDSYAAALGLDTRGLPNKDAVLKAIHDKEAEQ
ncbi:endonuclease VII [Mycobacterium phage Sejanus]|nr:endonuclease VII [Mycobacterium phage Sejanus]